MRYVIILPALAILAFFGTKLIGGPGDEAQQLRAMGPRGLEIALERYEAQLRNLQKRGDDNWKGISAFIDAVAGQKDAHASRLYWYTDFDAAQAAAKESGKPILSLRLLGNLDTELSCANSRFFRTTLYCNTEVSDYLRENFVLHWNSVRPVPKITIDFGDGRKIERTITGNSIHYVLTPDGRVIDALPGLYGPAAFVRGLRNAEVAATRFAKDADEASLRAYHSERLTAIHVQWEKDLRQIDLAPLAAQPARSPSVAAAPGTRPPPALVVARDSGAKRAAEVPIIAAVTPPGEFAAAADDAAWAKIAALHAEDAQLDAATKRLIRAKHPNAREAGERARTKAMHAFEDPTLRMIANLHRSIAEDTVRNEYLLHARLHEWFSTGTAPRDLNALNERVYAELFLTPSSDPWLGLAPDDAFAAIESGGLSVR